MNIPDSDGLLFPEFPPVSTEQWETQINADLKGADYEKRLIWKTHEGIKIKPYYRVEDLESVPFSQTLPGSFPFVRGTNTEGNTWEVRQDISHEDPEQANRVAVDAVDRGAAGIGFRAKKISSPEDMSRLIRFIEPEKTAVHFISAREYPYVAELFIRELQLRGTDRKKVKGSLHFDPFNYFLLYGQYYNSLEDNLNEAEYLITKIQPELPDFRMIHVSGDVFHNAGGHCAQELAFALASGNEYLARLTGKGLSVDQVAGAMHFTFAIGSNYFLEIARIRAARLLWATIVDAYHPAQKESAVMHIHGVTSTWNKTVYDPWVNMLRSTTEAMSGAIAGCNSITVHPFDAHFRTPDDFSERLARNTQIVLKEEAYLDKVADPSAGSYYIENLTNMVAGAAWDLFRDIEARGGFLAAAADGSIRQSIEETARRRDLDIARKTTVVLGTNQYPNGNETMLDKLESTVRKEYPGLKLYRGAMPFEALRLATERHVASGHPHPRVFLFTIGNATMRKARAAFASSFFGCAGYEILDHPGYATTDEGVTAAVDSDAAIAVICSSDEEYGTLGTEIARRLKAMARPVKVVVAGNPAESADALTHAGVDGFIHLRSDLLATLQHFHQELGIL